MCPGLQDRPAQAPQGRLALTSQCSPFKVTSTLKPFRVPEWQLLKLLEKDNFQHSPGRDSLDQGLGVNMFFLLSSSLFLFNLKSSIYKLACVRYNSHSSCPVTSFPDTCCVSVVLLDRSALRVRPCPEPPRCP